MQLAGRAVHAGQAGFEDVVIYIFGWGDDKLTRELEKGGKGGRVKGNLAGLQLTEIDFDGQVDSEGDLGLNQVACAVEDVFPGGGGGGRWAEGGGADLGFSGPIGNSRAGGGLE